MELAIISVLVLILIIIIYFNKTNKPVKVVEVRGPVKVKLGSFRIPEVALTDLDLDGREYANQLERLGNFLYEKYKDEGFVRKTIAEVKDSMRSPQLILIQLQNNVERHKMEDLEECLSE